jgi:hypothetical protein
LLRELRNYSICLRPGEIATEWVRHARSVTFFWNFSWTRNVGGRHVTPVRRI